MTLEQYAFLAEIVGTVLVVVSLVYVAQQIRQNSELVRIAAAEQGVLREFEITGPLIEDRELAKIWLTGGRDFDSLDEPDKWRLIFFERRAIIWWSHIHNLRKQGLYQDTAWRELIGIIQSLGHRQAIREAWNIFKDTFEPAFVDFMEQHLAVAERKAAVK